MKTLRLNIREAREARGLSQRKAAELAGMSVQTLANWERFERRPKDLLTLNRLLKVYGIRLSLQELQALGYALDCGKELKRIKFRVVIEDDH